MDDPTNQQSRLAYWNECEDMDFAGLRLYIADSVRLLSHPEESNDPRPASKKELLDLCDLLEDKAEAMKTDVPVPPKPTYDGPPDPGYFPDESSELTQLYRELESHERRIEDAIKDGSGNNYVDYVRKERGETLEKLRILENHERVFYDKQLDEYREALKPYRARLGAWSEVREKARQEEEVRERRAGFVARIRKQVGAAFSPRGGAERPDAIVQWDILPPGEATSKHIHNHYRESLASRGMLKEFDAERLEKVLALERTGWARAKRDAFEHYGVFRFAHTDKVLLECPVYGNAAFVVDYEDERWLTMTKQQIVQSGHARRIPHAGDWYERLKAALDF